jgi:hypothetical protein
MKRAVYEWSALFAATMALVCAVWWGTSTYFHAADLKLLLFGGEVVDFASNRGAIIFCHPLAELETLDVADAANYKPSDFGPKATMHGFRLPGLNFYYLSRPYFTGGSDTGWRLRISLLLVSALFAIVSAFCFWQLRQTRQVSPSSTNPSPELAGSRPN